MLQEPKLRRAGALLLVVVALFSCLAPALDARASEIRPDDSGFTTIPPPEIQQDMGSPMAPDPGGVTMVLPEAQEQEKGGTVPVDALHELDESVSGEIKKQIGSSGAAAEDELGELVSTSAADHPAGTAIHEEQPDSDDGPSLDEDVTIVIDTVPPMGLMVGADSGPLQASPAIFVFQNGSTHMLYTVSPQPQNPIDTRWRFDRWVGGPTTWGWNITVNGSQTYTARFITQYLITILANFPGLHIGSDMPGCEVPQSTPIYCWADEDSSPSLIVPTPQLRVCRFEFISWSDGDLRALRPIGPVTGPATYLAMFLGECTVTIQDTCTGRPPVTSWYPLGEALDLTWIPPSGLPPRERYRFIRWICDGPGCYSGPNPNPALIIQGPINETAVCVHEFLVNVDTNPTGIDYNIDDANCNGLTSIWWANQSKHWLNLTTLSYQVGTVRYLFTHWSDGVTLPQRQVLIAAPEDFIAYYDRPQVKLTLLPPVIGGIRCVEHPDCWYNEFEMATAQVTSPWAGGADTRYVFVQWSGDASGFDTSIQILMDAPKTVLADWAISYRLEVISSYGNPQCSIADCWYPSGAPATVTLEDPFITGTGSRQKFVNWSVDATGSANPLTLTMDGPKTVSASWKPQFLLTVVSECASFSDCGSPIGAGWYDGGKDATASLTETVVENGGMRCLFVEWSGDASGTGDHVTVTVDRPLTLIAEWVVQFWLTVTSDCGGASDCETPAGQGWYDNQSYASLTVNATFTDSSGNIWDFVEWIGDASGKDLSVAVLMDSPKSVTAMWIERAPSNPNAPFDVFLIAIVSIIVAVILAAVLLFARRRKRSKDENPNGKTMERNDASQTVSEATSQPRIKGGA